MAGMQTFSLGSSVHLSGVGIHSGVECHVVLRPARLGTGIVFRRVDLEGDVEILVGPSVIGLSNRATILTSNGVSIRTPEHLLSALFGLGILDCIVELDSEELPIFDGSSLPFVEAILDVGRVAMDSLVAPWIIEAPVEITLSTPSDQKSLRIEPYPHLKFTYTFEYPGSFLGTQTASFTFGEDVYSRDLAPARTFGFQHEIEALQARGLALGGSLENALVIGAEDYLTPPRFLDECARHKVLDMIGDFSILGRPIVGHVIGVRTGHQDNLDAVMQLMGSDPDG